MAQRTGNYISEQHPVEHSEELSAKYTAVHSEVHSAVHSEGHLVEKKKVHFDVMSIGTMLDAQMTIKRQVDWSSASN